MEVLRSQSGNVGYVGKGRYVDVGSFLPAKIAWPNPFLVCVRCLKKNRVVESEGVDEASAKTLGMSEREQRPRGPRREEEQKEDQVGICSS